MQTVHVCKVNASVAEQLFSVTECLVYLWNLASLSILPKSHLRRLCFIESIWFGVTAVRAAGCELHQSIVLQINPPDPFPVSPLLTGSTLVVSVGYMKSPHNAVPHC